MIVCETESSDITVTVPDPEVSLIPSPELIEPLVALRMWELRKAGSRND